MKIKYCQGQAADMEQHQWLGSTQHELSQKTADSPDWKVRGSGQCQLPVQLLLMTARAGRGVDRKPGLIFVLFCVITLANHPCTSSARPNRPLQ